MDHRRHVRRAESALARPRPQSAIRGNKFNLAVGGADVASMLLQAKKAVGLKPAPELVVVQGIDHDVRCDTVSHKPFQVAFARVLNVLATGLPDATSRR